MLSIFFCQGPRKVFEKATPPRAGGVAFSPGSGKKGSSARKAKQETQT
jgi:hypothetical protein